MNSYVEALYNLLNEKSDPVKADPMKKYLKDRFEFFGIQANPRRDILKEFIKENGLPNNHDLEKVAQELFALPQRELHHCALEITEKVSKKTHYNWISLYEYLILTNSWWDTVDFISVNLVGEYFKRNNSDIIPTTEKWMFSKNIWLQRTCLLFQLKYKANTDVQLLKKYIDLLSSSKEFFIQKAIGWILREYSKTDSKFVIQFVDESNISNFSKREALKWIKNKGMI